MKLDVSAGFGELVTEPWLDRVRSVAGGIRQDIPNGLHATAVHALVREIALSGLDMISLVAGWLWGWPDGSGIHRDERRKPTPGQCFDIVGEVVWAWDEARNSNKGCLLLEVGPEINIDPVYAKNFGHLLECVSAVHQRLKVMGRQDVPIMAGSVSNIDRDDGMKYLRAWLPRLHDRYWVGVHPYRTTRKPDKFKGYASADEMKQDLLSLISGRPFAVTEAGWHDARQTYGGVFGACKSESQFTPDEVARFAIEDIDFWKGAGAERYCWYQIRDGDPQSKDIEAHFGAHLADGTRKPVADALQRSKEGLA